MRLWPRLPRCCPAATRRRPTWAERRPQRTWLPQSRRRFEDPLRGRFDRLSHHLGADRFHQEPKTIAFRRAGGPLECAEAIDRRKNFASLQRGRESFAVANVPLE